MPGAIQPKALKLAAVFPAGKRASCLFLTGQKAPYCLDEQAVTEWLGEKSGAIAKIRRQISPAIAGYEEERYAPLMKDRGDVVNAFTPEVHIKYRGAARRAASKTYGSCKRACRAYNLPTCSPQGRLHGHGDERLVFNHKYTGGCSHSRLLKIVAGEIALH